MIYFVGPESRDMVKIGYSAKVATRVENIRASCPVSILVFGVCPGSMRDERNLHDQFHPDRIRHEWFRFSDAIRRHIERNCEPFDEIGPRPRFVPSSPTPSQVAGIRNLIVTCAEDFRQFACDTVAVTSLSYSELVDTALGRWAANRDFPGKPSLLMDRPRCNQPQNAAGRRDFTVRGPDDWVRWIKSFAVSERMACSRLIRVAVLDYAAAIGLKEHGETRPGDAIGAEARARMKRGA